MTCHTTSMSCIIYVMQRHLINKAGPVNPEVRLLAKAELLRLEILRGSGAKSLQVYLISLLAYIIECHKQGVNGHDATRDAGR